MPCPLSTEQKGNIMLSRIESQLKRLDEVLIPEFKQENHEVVARIALKEIKRMKKLLQDILLRDQEIVFLFYFFYLGEEQLPDDDKIANGIKFSTTKTLEKILGEDKLEVFIDLYEKVDKQGKTFKWPICDNHVEEVFEKDAKGKSLEL